MNSEDLRKELELVAIRTKLMYHLMSPALTKRRQRIAIAALSMLFLAGSLFLPGNSLIPGVQGSWAATVVYYPVAAFIAFTVRAQLKIMEQSRTMSLS